MSIIELLTSMHKIKHVEITHYLAAGLVGHRHQSLHLLRVVHTYEYAST